MIDSTARTVFQHQACGRVATAVVVSLCLASQVCQAQFDDIPPTESGPLTDNSSVTVPVEPLGHNTQTRLRHVAGDGITNSKSYSSIDLLTPLTSSWSDWGNEMIGFFDGRWIIQNDGKLAGSFGLGGRRYFANTDQIWGAGVAYNIDDTHRNKFHQLVVTAERFGETFDFNISGHFPFGDKQQPYAYSETSTTPTFHGTSVVFGRSRFDEVAYQGVTGELGVHLPGEFAHEHDLALFAGYYHFDADNSPAFDGFSGRLQGSLWPNFYAQLQLTSDDQFKTRALLYLTWEFSRFSSESSGPRRLRSRMTDFSERPSQVVVAEQAFYDPVPATITPGGGSGGSGGGSGTSQPLNLFHVNSSAPAGGDGSLDNPFQTLTEAAANSSTGDILFLHADSVFDGEYLILQGNQRLWGEGLVYSVETDMGTIQIPRATSGTTPPVIRNAPSVTNTGAITLASGTQVLGVTLEDALGPALFGDGLSGELTISNNTIQRAFRGIEIRNSSATFAITETPISDTVDDAIQLTDNTGTFTFTGTTSIDNPGGGVGAGPNGGVGISIQGNSATGTVTFEGVEITNRSSTAINIGRNQGAITFGQAIAIANPNGSQDEAIGIANSGGDVTFADVTIDDTDRDPLDPRGPGMPSVFLGNNSNTVTFNSLNIETSNGAGLQALNIANVVIKDGTINATGGRAVEINGMEAMDVTFNSVSATNTDVGILLATTDSGFAGNFTITGDGEHLGSGGTMSNVDAGVLTGNVENVVLNFLNISSSIDGISAWETDNLVVNASTLTGTNDDWVGIDVHNTDQDKPGSPVIFTGNTINSDGDNTIGIRVTSAEAPAPGIVRIDDQTIGLTGAGALGIYIDAQGDAGSSGTGDITLMSLQNNSVTAPTVYDDLETDATIFGQLLINGVLFP